MNIRPALAPLVALMAIACSDNSGSVAPGDTTAPTIVSVTPHDVYHVDVTFSEALNKDSAENRSNYVLAATDYANLALGVPGDTMIVFPALMPDRRTVTMTVTPAMFHLKMSLSVSGVLDTHGNRMTTPATAAFISNNSADNTPPEIYYRSPAPGASNVAVGAPVVIEFSEPLNPSTVRPGIQWNAESGPVDYYLSVRGTTYTLTPRHLLAYKERQTITVSQIQDFIQNTMPPASWSFTTTSIVDRTPPTVVATSPRNGTLNVDVNTNISITFSEPINQFQFELAGNPGMSGDMWWSGDGRTFTIDPQAALFNDRQYTITVFPTGVYDLAGNTVTGITNIVFSTGKSLENGSFSGVVSGAPGTAAADPTGAIVVAGWYTPLAYTQVVGNDSYTIMHLEDGSYAILAFKDTNGDGNPTGDGDAIGAYGADPAAGDFDFSTVQLTGGAHITNLDFPIYDPSFVTGRLTYEGAYQSNTPNTFVGLFAKAGFDPSTSQPVAVTLAYSPYGGTYSLNNMESPFPDGDYYVGAFMDADNNGLFNRAVDPLGVYGGVATPTVVHLAKGSDAFGADILISDPVPGIAATAVHWPAPVTGGKMQRLYEMARTMERQPGGSSIDEESSGATTR
ncbi:MAG TPA: Ig-like domain-containing protein [Candidatus Krumholzibacteria bacterium]|nr:Ig-like domain-containing protein [Candidatus Krumholzibacteria bacterium]